MSDERDLVLRMARLEERLEDLERWKETVASDREEVAPATESSRPSRAEEPPPLVAEDVEVAVPVPKDKWADPDVVQPPPVEFDIALVGRSLIVLGGAFLLRAITESGVLPAGIGVFLGLAYAVTWLLIALRPPVSRTSSAYHGLSAILAAYPLVFEATRKFDVFDSWSSALVLSIVSALWILLSWRKMLHGLAWVATLGAMMSAVLLMAETSSMVPFVWYLTALGVTTLWMGYRLRWLLLRWPTAVFLDGMLLLMAFLVVTDRAGIHPTAAMAAGAGAFAGYLVSFVVRNLLRERNVVMFDVVQTIGVLLCGLGGAMWVAGATDTLEVPFALAILALAAACYGASFIFVPRYHTSPNSFFFYSTLALVLVLGAATFIAEGLPSSVLWSALALTSAFFAGRYEKPVLAVHSAIYLVAGLIGAGLVQSGVRILALNATGEWSVPWAGALLILGASVVAAAIHPIKRKGVYRVWAFAKLVILLVLGWTTATLLMGVVGRATYEAFPHPGMVAFERTAILSGLTIIAAWVARYAVLSPGRRLANILMIALAMKLIWDDLRVGSAVTMFLSFACVGAAMIVATRLRKSAVEPGDVES